MDTMEGKLPENVLLFTHLLRASGIKIGSDGVTDAISAIKTLGLKSKRAFYFSLLTCLTKKKEDEIIFRQAFDLFWQNPKFQEKTRNMLLPRTRVSEQDEQKEELAQRIRENLPKTEKIKKLDELEDNIIFDTSGSASDIQLKKSKDFGTMSKNELRQATDVIRDLSVHLPQKPFRRFEPKKMGPHLSVRHGLKDSVKNFGIVLPKFMKKKEKDRPIVFLIDISGSMENYSKMLLHFVHNLMQRHRNCLVFLFGTKLTNITHLLKNKDIDDALQKISKVTDDWAGGTRIRDSIYEFNKTWVRRTPVSGSLVLFISDGLDKNHQSDLLIQMERLKKNCKYLLWLNPLLRYKKFLPKSVSIKRILKNVDALLPIHSLESIENLTLYLSRKPKGDSDILNWRTRILDREKELTA
ncbi:MAG: VWA domain-containing protein [Alphaproteobacteria bacterium]|nr:MAG: VWA domain-containing protein [Alphaproteobacteria bacterium]